MTTCTGPRGRGAPLARPAAVREAGGGAISYRELDRLSDRLRDRLVACGVRPRRPRRLLHRGRRSTPSPAIFGVLKAGAAYVPVDPGAPAARNGLILADCAVAAVVVERRFEAALRAELAGHGVRPELLVIDGAGGGGPLARRARRRRRPRPGAVGALRRSGAGRARLHPLYLRLHRPTQGRPAHPPQRHQLRGVVRRDLRARARRPLLVARPASISTSRSSTSTARWRAAPRWC